MGAEAQHRSTANGLIKAGSRKLHGPYIPLDTFVLGPEEVASLQQQYQISIEELMQHLVQPASLLARTPTSNFPVGYSPLALALYNKSCFPMQILCFQASKIGNLTRHLQTG